MRDKCNTCKTELGPWNHYGYCQKCRKTCRICHVVIPPWGPATCVLCVHAAKCITIGQSVKYAWTTPCRKELKYTDTWDANPEARAIRIAHYTQRASNLQPLFTKEAA